MGQRIEQQPIAPIAMEVDYLLLSRATREKRWQLWIYAQDDHGRTWHTTIDVEQAPTLTGGSRLFDHEIIEVDE